MRATCTRSSPRDGQTVWVLSLPVRFAAQRLVRQPHPPKLGSTLQGPGWLEAPRKARPLNAIVDARALSLSVGSRVQIRGDGSKTRARAAYRGGPL